MIKRYAGTLLCAALLLPLLSAQTASVRLQDAALQTGASLYWDPLSGSGLLEKNGHQLSFHAGDPLVLLDYNRFAVTDAPQKRDGGVYVTQAFLAAVSELFASEVPEVFYRIGAILIDPGHGGRDPGALDTHTINGRKITLKEKDVTLRVSTMLAEKLKAAYPDKKIMLTRSTDTTLSLEQRVDIANSVQLEPHEAILYVSIHANASLDKKASGYEVWYLSPGFRRTVIASDAAEDEALLPILNSMMEEEYTTESILIAKFIMDGLGAQIGDKSSSRGIKAEEWFVVRNANMPSVLVETGFITNEKEAALLADPEYLRKIAVGIYNGLAAFVTHFERSRGFTGTQ
ncbi:N-acetylmuramoyl-L-alanine amidase [Treponema brennaborense]|uniref:N-acetylmuramoyl-L-alanine amidase n=1 Tax=Treponema brennaborense (strain DSM 12168 / CIP 105900 / DD5/3) TaxID=906968 RepID=F4LIN1_TREBD|nr:N-acetylmuramoyl-L-alanine amidase [Treponema brennaborense]AEE17256.1 cell wall hydrolase/autolysin [Treponema brennaborense DSM 12168]